MKDRKHNGGSRARVLTAEEHLWLHRRIERRAHELWLTDDCHRKTALENWLQAEREAWKKFERVISHRHDVPASDRRRAFL